MTITRWNLQTGFEKSKKKQKIDFLRSFVLYWNAGDTPWEYEFWSSKVSEEDHVLDGICMSLQFLSTDLLSEINDHLIELNFCSSLTSNLDQIYIFE